MPCLLNHSSYGGHVGSLHIVNSTAANMGLQMSLHVLSSFPLDKYLEEGSWSRVLGPFVIVKKLPTLLFTLTPPIDIPTKVCKGSLCLQPHQKLLTFAVVNRNYNGDKINS